jgi:hypothetical protein
MKDKYYMIISKRCRKVLCQNSTVLLDKSPEESRNRKDISQYDKGYVKQTGSQHTKLRKS